MPSTQSRIYGPALIATGPTTVVTVPAATKYVVRHIHIINPTGGAVTFTLSIGVDAAGTRIFEVVSIAAGGRFDDFGIYVLAATEIIQLTASSNNVLVGEIFAEVITL